MSRLRFVSRCLRVGPRRGEKPPRKSVRTREALPTGVVFNATGSNTDFLVTGSVVSRPAAFLFANSIGQIVAWNPRVGERDENGNILTFSLTGHVELQGADGPFYYGLTLGTV